MEFIRSSKNPQCSIFFPMTKIKPDEDRPAEKDYEQRNMSILFHGEKRFLLEMIESEALPWRMGKEVSEIQFRIGI